MPVSCLQDFWTINSISWEAQCTKVLGPNHQLWHWKTPNSQHQRWAWKWSAGNAPIFFRKKQAKKNATHPRPTRILLFYFGALYIFTTTQKLGGLCPYGKTTPGCFSKRCWSTRHLVDVGFMGVTTPPGNTLKPSSFEWIFGDLDQPLPPSKYNMEPENKSLEKESPFGNHYFQVPC